MFIHFWKTLNFEKEYVITQFTEYQTHLGTQVEWQQQHYTMISRVLFSQSDKFTSRFHLGQTVHVHFFLIFNSLSQLKFRIKNDPNWKYIHEECSLVLHQSGLTLNLSVRPSVCPSICHVCPQVLILYYHEHMVDSWNFTST